VVIRKDFMSNDQNDELERKVRALFEDSVERLDARTRSRLTQARNRALEEVTKGAVQRRWLWAPAGGLLAAALVAAVMLWPGVGRAPLEAGAMPLEDFDIVADSENLELLQDMEFYVWLQDQAPEAGNQTG
jgi:hypothetical protein